MHPYNTLFLGKRPMNQGEFWFPPMPVRLELLKIRLVADCAPVGRVLFFRGAGIFKDGEDTDGVYINRPSAVAAD